MTVVVRGTDLLIAPPGLPDPRFRNTVLMLTHNQRSGSFALCVNKPTKWCLDDVVTADDIEVDYLPRVPVFWGGPVSPSSLWMMHSAEWSTKHTVSLDSNWAMTSDAEMFQALAAADFPQHFRIVMGYCSWAPNQLQGELEGRAPWSKDHSWLVAHNLGPEWLFEQDPDDLWANATTLSGHQAVSSWL